MKWSQEWWLIKDSGLDENSSVTITKGAVKDAASARTLVDINSIVLWQDADLIF